MKHLLFAAAILATIPAATWSQESKESVMDAGALYALSSVSGARPNCTTLVGNEDTPGLGNPEARWLVSENNGTQWRLVQVDDETVADGALVGETNVAVSLFVVCGIPARSNADLIRLADAVQKAARDPGKQ